MQNKTTLRFHSTPVWMVIIKNRKDKGWQEWEWKGELAHCWWEYKLVQSLWKSVWRFLKKLKTEFTDDPAIHFWLYT
jgi:hypothetical protein